MTDEKKVPHLRFPDFDGDWKPCKLGEVVNIVMGQSPNSENYTDNPNDNILVQGNADMKNGRVVPRVWTTQITKQAEKNDLILSVRAPVGDIGKTDYTVVLGRGVAAIKGNEFIFQTLGKMKFDGYWNKLSTGSTFESINSNDIKNAMLKVPSIEEQTKIGNFFKQLDKAITLQERKLENIKKQKKGLLQRLFPDRDKSLPNLRFPEFSEKWSKVKLSEVLIPTNEKNNVGKYTQDDVLAASLGTELDKKHLFFGLKSTEESIKKYKVVNIGNVIYTKSPIKGYPNGIIRTNKKVEGIVPSLYCVYKCKENINPNIIQCFFEDKSRLDAYLFPLVNVGARNNVNITDLEFLEGSICIPSDIHEQNKIVSFLTDLTNQITLQEQKLEYLKKRKKALLQQMFI